MSALATGTPGVLAAPKGYSSLKVGQLWKAPAQGWFHGCGTSESHRGRPCAWGLMLCISHLEILNHFVLEFTFFKGSLMGQWKLQGTWSPGHVGSGLPQPSRSLGHVRSSTLRSRVGPASFPLLPSDCHRLLTPERTWTQAQERLGWSGVCLREPLKAGHGNGHLHAGLTVPWGSVSGDWGKVVGEASCLLPSPSKEPKHSRMVAVIPCGWWACGEGKCLVQFLMIR